MGTSAPAVKAAVVAAATTLFAADPTVQVSYGITIPTAGRDGFAVANIETTVTRPVLGRASRNEVHRIQLIASVMKFGGAEQQVIATARAYALIDALAERLRLPGHEIDAVAARSDAWITSYELDEFGDNEQLQARGRYAAVTATLTVDIRL